MTDSRILARALVQETMSPHAALSLTDLGSDALFAVTTRLPLESTLRLRQTCKTFETQMALNIALDVWHAGDTTAERLVGLIRKGLLPAFKHLLDKSSLTADQLAACLWTAATHGRNRALILLIGRGAPVNQVDQCGQTALMIASENNHPLCARTLLGANAYVDDVNEYGRTALMIASENGHHLCAQELLNAGAWADQDVNETGLGSENALVLACMRGHEMCVRVLINAGAAVDIIYHTFD